MRESKSAKVTFNFPYQCDAVHSLNRVLTTFPLEIFVQIVEHSSAAAQTALIVLVGHSYAANDALDA
jgi:hypothetical protein